MEKHLVQHFISKLTSLNRGNTPYGLGPHKPILLLSILDWMDGQSVLSKEVKVIEKLVHIFNKNWNLLVTTQHRRNIFLPLHHLGDGLGWHLISKEGNIIKDKFSSLKRIESQVAYGKFSEEFSKILFDEEIRFLFKTVILDSYFPDTKNKYWETISENPLLKYQKEIEAQILQESKQKYWTKVNSKLQFRRDWKFEYFVKGIYQNTCIISKLQVEPNHGIIEACHILPHAEFGNDSINNGITLCLNLHKAFDRGLISIGKDYEVIFNKKKIFNENTSPYNLSQFKNQSIILPENKNYYPSQDYLQWHRKEHGF